MRVINHFELRWVDGYGAVSDAPTHLALAIEAAAARVSSSQEHITLGVEDAEQVDGDVLWVGLLRLDTMVSSEQRVLRFLHAAVLPPGYRLDLGGWQALVERCYGDDPEQRIRELYEELAVVSKDSGRNRLRPLEIRIDDVLDVLGEPECLDDARGDDSDEPAAEEKGKRAPTAPTAPRTSTGRMRASSPSLAAPAVGRVPTGNLPVVGRTPTGNLPAQGRTPTGNVPVQGRTPTGNVPVQGRTPTGNLVAARPSDSSIVGGVGKKAARAQSSPGVLEVAAMSKESLDSKADALVSAGAKIGAGSTEISEMGSGPTRSPTASSVPTRHLSVGSGSMAGFPAASGTMGNLASGYAANSTTAKMLQLRMEQAREPVSTAPRAVRGRQRLAEVIAVLAIAMCAVIVWRWSASRRVPSDPALRDQLAKTQAERDEANRKLEVAIAARDKAEAGWQQAQNEANRCRFDANIELKNTRDLAAADKALALANAATIAKRDRDAAVRELNDKLATELKMNSSLTVDLQGRDELLRDVCKAARSSHKACKRP